jgi:DNA-binding FrmR family transcriptional regulator
MPKENSLLDNEFDEFDDKDFVHSFGDDKEEELPAPKKDDKEEEGIVVDVVDDTPEEDRDKWKADGNDADKGDDEDDEAVKYSEKVKKRIAKETAKVHAERRAKEDRERQLQEAVAFAQRILNENNQLKGLIENGEKVLVSESTGRLKGQIDAAKAALREAHEAADINAQIAAQEVLAKLVAEQDRLSMHRPQALPRMDEKELSRFQQPQQVQPQVPPDAQAWQDKNRWFGRDEIMTSFAMGLHSHIVNREGLVPGTDEYYGRIDKEMRSRFPERFQSKTAPRRTDTVVAPAVRSNGGGGTRKVTLTESQARLAKRLGLTLEQYAEQVVAENGSKKEWTYGSNS